MKSFRNPRYLERYEDVIFDLKQPINTADPANNAAQVRQPNLKFIADNTGEATPFDWYNARMSMDFKLSLLVGGNLTLTDHNGIVNGSNSFIKKLTILAMEKKFIVVMKQIMLQILKTYLSIIPLMQRVLELKNFTILIQVGLQRNVLLKQNTM